MDHKQRRDAIQLLTLEKGNIKTKLKDTLHDFDRVAAELGLKEYDRREFARQVWYLLDELDHRWFQRVHEIMEQGDK